MAEPGVSTEVEIPPRASLGRPASLPERTGAGHRADVEWRRAGRLDEPLPPIFYPPCVAVAAGAAPFLEAGGYSFRSEVRLSPALRLRRECNGHVMHGVPA